MFDNTVRRFGIAAVLCVLMGGMPELSRVSASWCAPAYTLGAPRGSGAPVLVRSSYDYAPSIHKEGNLYRMWWCGGVAGDHIMYAESTNLDGGWSTPISVFQPTYQFGTFDEQHVCDPSVIRVNGTYYLYYGGAEAKGHPGLTPVTRIGVASSPNGITWTRLNNGRPIVSPTRGPGHPDFLGLPSQYGAGQPTAAYVDGQFYLMFTDTTGWGIDWLGRGQFVLRSADPTFQGWSEALVGPGVFAGFSPGGHTVYPLIYSWGTDWQYADETDSFVIGDGHHVWMFDASLSRLEGHVQLTTPGLWIEGAGLVSTPERRAVRSSCNVLRLDLMQSVHAPGDPENRALWDLAHFGADWLTGLPCDCVQSPTLNALGMNTVGDFTGDNRDDLGNHHRASGTFWIRRNLGNGTFAAEHDRWPTGTAAPSTHGWQTIVADFDGDNYADFADRHPASGHVWAHRNRQNGTFDPVHWNFGYTAVGPNIEVLAGDFDGDGRADLLEHNRKTGRLSVRRNHGAGDNAFRPAPAATTFRTVNGAAGFDWRLVAADFNGDGWTDIAEVAMTSKNVYVHQNIGNYQFSDAAWAPFASHGAFTAIFGDFDGDGWADYADVNVGNGEVWPHRNLRNQTFDPNHIMHGFYSITGGGMWILGLPIAFP